MKTLDGKITICKDKQRKIIMLYKKGYSMTYIHKDLHVDKFTIKKVLFANEIEIQKMPCQSNNILWPHPRCTKLSECDADEIVGFYQDGRELSFIGEKYHISPRRIRQILTYKGISERNRYDLIRINFTTKQKTYIVNEYLNGVPVLQIAKHLNISDLPVKKFLKSKSIKIRSRTGAAQRKLTGKERLQILAMHKKKATLAKMYDRTGIAPHIIKRFLREEGIELPAYSYSRILPTEIVLLVNDYRNGASATDIKEKYHISHEFLIKILADFNISIRPAGEYISAKISPEDERQIRHLYLKEGLTLTKLSHEFKCSLPRIRDILLKENIQIRPPSSYVGPKLSHNPSRGYSGYYKDHWFRSRDELSFLIVELERKNRKWESAEQLSFRIQYIDHDGRSRSYYPDYFVDDKYLIEIKPSKFWENLTVKCKSNAAKIFCETNGFIYQMIDYPFKFEELREEFLLGNIIFTNKNNKYFDKFMTKLKS